MTISSADSRSKTESEIGQIASELQIQMLFARSILRLTSSMIYSSHVKRWLLVSLLPHPPLHLALIKLPHVSLMRTGRRQRQHQYRRTEPLNLIVITSYQVRGSCQRGGKLLLAVFGRKAHARCCQKNASMLTMRQVTISLR